MRYRGQSYELMVPFNPDFLAGFHRQHEQAYGYSHLAAPVEIVNIRLRAVGQVPPPLLAAETLGEVDASAALVDRLPVVFSSGEQDTPFYRGELLRPGNRLTGPALVARSDTTILVGPPDHASVDAYGNLWVEIWMEARAS